MNELAGRGPVKRAQVEAVVIRADGTREDLGVISDSKWRRWSVTAFCAARRIRKANRNVER